MGRPFLACLLAAGGLPLLPLVLPYVGGLFLLFVPAPYVVLGHMIKERQILPIVAVCILPFSLYALFSGNVGFLLINIQLVVTGLIIGYLLKKNMHPYKAILAAVLLVAAVEAIVFLAISAQREVAPGHLIDQYIDSQLKAKTPTGQSVGSDLDQDFAIEHLKELLRKIYPSLVLIVGALLGLMNLALGNLVFAKPLRLKLLDHHQILTWSPRREAVWVFVVSGFGTLILDGLIRAFSLNLLLLVLCVYFFQGIAVLAWWMERAKMASWIRIIIFVSIALQQFFLPLVSFLGVIDNWANFRRIDVKGKKEAI